MQTPVLPTPHFNADAFLGTGLQGLFYILLFIFTLHALFLAYHWFTYGDNKHISLVALAVYLSGGAVLFLTLALTLNSF
jgi:hypothetical protein